MATLTVLQGPENGQSFTLQPGRITLGRISDADVHIRISHPSISRRHAIFTYQNNLWHLEDLGSQNGIFIAGKRVTNAALERETDIIFGSVKTHFSPGQIQQSPEATNAEPPPTESLAELAPEDIKRLGQFTQQVMDQFGQAIVGQKEVAAQLLIAIAAGGHCLMIGLPGLAKTLMVSTLAQILKLNFKRVQFTPDLMPSDIIGTDILDVDEQTGRKSFRFIKGPIFTNMLLADEINRTPPKTQAALLEAMQEKQVTAANQRFQLDPPFFVLATQNPLEQEGTYPLPEAQLDRFMFNILVDYPTEDEEEQIVMATTARNQVHLRQVLTAQDLIAIQKLVRDLPVSQHLVKYATRLVRMTRPNNPDSPDFIRQNVHCGAGPRAAQCLVLGAKARAILNGRVNVSCQDVKALALPVLRHRIFTNFNADSEGITPDSLIEKLLNTAKEPSPDDYR